MELTLKMFLIACPLVFLAGFVDSIGGGGGLISVPAFLMAGLPAHNAAATNKLSACCGTVMATIRYIKTGKVDYVLAIPSVAMALLGSFFGTKLALLLSDAVFKIVLVALVPLIAIVVLKNKTLEPKDKTPLPRKKEILLVALFGLIIGCYDGFYGPGTGTFLILVYTKLVKKDILTAESNSKICNLASNISSMTVFLFNGATLIPLGLACAVCSIAGNYLGAGLTIKNGAKFVRIIILFVILLLAIKVLFDYFI